MHDPMTVICDLPLPWKHKVRDKNGKVIFSDWATWGTLWHVDPETDGTDDSCGWGRPRLNETTHRELVDEIVEWEHKFPYYFNRPAQIDNPEYQYHSISPGDTAMLVLSLWSTFAWRLYRKTLTPKQVARALQLGYDPHDNFRSSFVCTHGSVNSIKEQQRRTVSFVLKAYLREIRPWYRHPRWHINHWKLQVFFIQNLKRWLFSRCTVCGTGFKYGESVCGGWHSDGPRWFKSENVWHLSCKDPSIKSPAPNDIP